MTFKTEREKALLFEVLKHMRSSDMFQSYLSANDGNEDLRAMVQSMVDHHILVPNSHVPEFSRYHHEQLFFLLSGGVPTDVTRNLSRKELVIVGCGGIGCLAAYTLVTAGIQHVTLMDADTVEPYNISRQFAYAEADVGEKKVHVLREQLLSRDSQATVVALDQRAVFSDTDSNVPDADFVILAADEPGIIQKANKALVRRRIPFMHICYINDIAAWGPLVIPGKSGCWACQTHIGSAEVPNFPERTEVMKSINRNYVCPVISSISTSAVALAALDVIRFLGEFARPASIDRRIGLWTHDLHFEFQDFSRSRNCQVCGIASPFGSSEGRNDGRPGIPL